MLLLTQGMIRVIPQTTKLNHRFVDYNYNADMTEIMDRTNENSIRKCWGLDSTYTAHIKTKAQCIKLQLTTKLLLSHSSVGT